MPLGATNSSLRWPARKQHMWGGRISTPGLQAPSQGRWRCTRRQRPAAVVGRSGQADTHIACSMQTWTQWQHVGQAALTASAPRHGVGLGGDACGHGQQTGRQHGGARHGVGVPARNSAVQCSGQKCVMQRNTQRSLSPSPWRSAPVLDRIHPVPWAASCTKTPPPCCPAQQPRPARRRPVSCGCPAGARASGAALELTLSVGVPCGAHQVLSVGCRGLTPLNVYERMYDRRVRAPKMKATKLPLATSSPVLLERTCRWVATGGCATTVIAEDRRDVSGYGVRAPLTGLDFVRMCDQVHRAGRC